MVSTILASRWPSGISNDVQDPLKTWYRGRVFLIGDAAHPMLPTQGQGASQSIEDAEALGAFFEDLDTTKSPSLEDLQIAFEVL